MDGALPPEQDSQQEKNLTHTGLISKVFEPIEALREGLAQLATSYILDGQIQEVAQAFRDSQAASLLQLGQARSENSPWFQLFAVADLEPMQWLRMAELLGQAELYSPLVRDDEILATRSGRQSTCVFFLLLRESAYCGRIEDSPFQRLESLLALNVPGVEYVHEIHSEQVVRTIANGPRIITDHLLEIPGVWEFVQQHQELVSELVHDRWRGASLLRFLGRFPEHRAIVEEPLAAKLAKALESDEGWTRLEALELLGDPRIPIDGFEEKLLAMSSIPQEECRVQQASQDALAVQLQGAAMRVLHRLGDKAQAHAQTLFEQESLGARKVACRLLYAIRREEAMDWLREKRESVEEASLQLLIEHVLECHQSRARSEQRNALLAHAKARGFLLNSPLSDDAFELFREALDAVIARAREIWTAESMNPYYEPWKFKAPEWYRAQLDSLCLGSAGDESLYRLHGRFGADCDLWAPFFAHPEVNCLHLVRMLVMMGDLPAKAQACRRRDWLFSSMRDYLEFYARAKKGLGILDLLAACEVVGVKVDRVLEEIILDVEQYEGLWISPESLADYCKDDPIPLFRTLSLEPTQVWQSHLRKRDFENVRAPGYKVLSHMSKRSRYVESQLIERAMALQDKEAALARRCLKGMAEKGARISLFLESSVDQERIRAARWLAQEGCKSEIPQLRARLSKEKQVESWVAIREALMAVDGDAGKRLDPSDLLQEAKRFLPKKFPAKIAWLPLEALPPLARRESGKKVDPAIVRWMIFCAFKLENPRGGPLLRFYMNLIEPRMLCDFGHVLALLWFSRDKEVFKDYQSTWEERFAFAGMERDVASAVMQSYAKLRKTSISASKGILALVSHCDSPELVDFFESYVLKHGWNRTALAKALVELLAAMHFPRAEAAIARISEEVRAATLKECAQEAFAANAERRQLTLEELRDCHVPNAGLGSDARCSLGTREIFFVLDDELNLRLRDAEGKTLKRMPSARKNEDPKLYTAAKKQYSAIKKTLQEIVTHQRDRLELAMYLGRLWPASHWLEYLCPHPIVGRMLSRIIWIERAVTGETRLFRPMDDGSFTNVEDEMVELDPKSKLQIAHASLMDHEAQQAWQMHLRDYSVTPLLTQLHTSPALDSVDIQALEKKLRPSCAPTLKLLQLEKRAREWGMVPTRAEPKGQVFSFERKIGGRELRVVLSFSGAFRPFEEQDVQVKGLVCSKLSGDWSRDRLAWEEVPKILLSSCAALWDNICKDGLR